MKIETMNCMNCGTVVKNGLCGREDEHTNIPHEDWQGCDVQITGGYSSDFDLQTFHGVICAPCLLKAMPNLYQVQRLEHVRDKYHYFPKGVIGHREWKPPSDPQGDQRLLESL